MSFEKISDEVAIDETMPRDVAGSPIQVKFWRVYYWAERPDPENFIEGHKSHWHPDSEHATKEEALKRAEALAGGSKKKSILVR